MNGSGTADTIAIWVDANTLGDGSNVDIAYSPAEQFEFGPGTGAGQIRFSSKSSSTGDGAGFGIFSGNPGPGGSGGDVTIQASDGDGANGVGGDVLITAGQGDGAEGKIVLGSESIVIVDAPVLGPLAFGQLGNEENMWTDAFVQTLTFITADHDEPNDPLVPVKWVAVKTSNGATSVTYRLPLYQ